MNKTIKNFIIFTCGSVCGYFASKAMLEKKYEARYHEEVQSYKDAHETVFSEIFEKENINKKDVNVEESVDVVSEIEKKDISEMVIDPIERPYVITPEDFGIYSDYKTATLFYHPDKILDDVDDNIINNVDDIVGEESLTHFGEYEDDSVYVRNDRLKTDYEILLSSCNYFD